MFLFFVTFVFVLRICKKNPLNNKTNDILRHTSEYHSRVDVSKYLPAGLCVLLHYFNDSLALLKMCGRYAGALHYNIVYKRFRI